MSIRSVLRSSVVFAGIACSVPAFAAPAAKVVPMPKQAASFVRLCEESRPAPGYRDIFVRFGTVSRVETRNVPAR